MADDAASRRYDAIGLAAGDVGLRRPAAVLVVDLQRLFLDPPLGTAATPRVLARTARLLEGARAARVPVVYVHVVYDDGEEAGRVWSTKAPVMRGLLRGSAAAEIAPEVAPEPGDLVLEKRRASAFFGTDLDARLRHLGVEDLVVVGTSTSGCVRATVVDAAQLDYGVTVVEDCVEDRVPECHTAALADIRAKYGDVRGSEEVLARLREVASAATP